MRGSELKSVTSNPRCRRVTSTPKPWYLRNSALSDFLLECKDPATTATIEAVHLTVLRTPRESGKIAKFSSSHQAALLEQFDVVTSTDTVQALMLTAAQPSMSTAIEGFNLFYDRTYTLASVTGSCSAPRYVLNKPVGSLSTLRYLVHCTGVVVCCSPLKVQVRELTRDKLGITADVSAVVEVNGHSP